MDRFTLSAYFGSQDRRWILKFAALVMLVTCVPYVLGYLAQGSEWRFTGFVLAVEDGNSYIAKMLAGSSGSWLFQTPYTTYPQRDVFIFIPYLLLGKLAAPLLAHDSLVILYHLFRFVAGVLACLATYDFLRLFIRERRLVRWGVALVILGGGLGWVLLLLGVESWLGSLPVEFYSPEAFGFLGLFGVPHLALARAILLWSLVAYLRNAESVEAGAPVWKTGLKVGLLWLLTGVIQPLTGMVVGAVVGWYLFTVVAWQLYLRVQGQSADWTRWFTRFKLAFWAGIVALPLVGYNLLVFNRDAYLKTWAAQSAIPSPHPLHYLLAYGLLLPFVLTGLGKILSSQPWNGWLPVAWVLSFPAMAYAPFSLQRRLPEGVWVALVVLALSGVRVSEKAFRTFQFASLLLLPSSFLLLFGSGTAVLNPGSPLFRPSGEARAFDCLGQLSKPGEVVLSSYETGNVLPAWAPVRVVIGHRPESANYSELQGRIQAFYASGTPDAVRRSLLSEFQVDYVFWGAAERKLGDWDADQVDYLEVLCENPENVIFRVKQ